MSKEKESLSHQKGVYQTDRQTFLKREKEGSPDKKERNSFTCNECMDLKFIMLNEVIQTEEIKYPRLILTCGI